MNQVHTISTVGRIIVAAALLTILSMFVTTAAPTHAQAQDDYSYTVQPGDGVTNLILDYAESTDKQISAARAYQIAKTNGQAFLDSGLTVESDLPYTEGIGAFETAGATITATDNSELFDSLDQSISSSPDAAEDEVTVEDADRDQAAADDETADDQAESANADEQGDQSETESDSDNVWPWIIGIAAIIGGLYYLNNSRDRE